MKFTVYEVEMKKNVVKRFSGTLSEELYEKLKTIAIREQRSMNVVFQIAIKKYADEFLSDEKNLTIGGKNE